MIKKNGKFYLDEYDDCKRDCCICKHFRMFKPEPEWCTVKKMRVDPLCEDEPCWELRKGLPVFNIPRKTKR